jgi:N-acetylglucosamine kinase
LGDEGSGYDIARHGLRAAVRGLDESGPATMLSGEMLSFCGVTDPESCIGVFYNPDMPRHVAAKFAQNVSKCAESGDRIAEKILLKCAESFAETAKALLCALPDAARLGLWGGVMQKCPAFRNHFQQAVARAFPRLHIGLLPAPPEVGALFAAFSSSGQNLTESQKKKIIAQMPEWELK